MVAVELGVGGIVATDTTIGRRVLLRRRKTTLTSPSGHATEL
ncbi:hypothetical protein ACWCPQ_32090 [Nocardia sp. NPDC001965]